jgi:selenocysteine lyase/cysteine desulfurase
VTPLPRSEFAVTERYTYLNHAATGVLPQRTLASVEAVLRGQASAGVLGVYPNELRLTEFRSTVARFIGANDSEIAIVRNTSDGANVVATGLDWRAGDEIVLCDNEFPANALPWLALRRFGVEIRFVRTEHERLTPDVLRTLMTPRTRVVAVSSVSFADGYRHDLAALSEITHAGGALFCVDAIQGLGVFPLDVRACDIDVLYSGGQKWLLALQGVAFVYVRESLIDGLNLVPGWRSVADIWDFLNYDQPYARNASRFEGGTPNFVGALALATSIELLETAPHGAIAAHVLALTDRLVGGLRSAGAEVVSPRGPGISSGIVLFRIAGRDSVALGKRLQSAGIITTWRANGIRVSPHGYNTAAEIDFLIEQVKQEA